MEGKCELTLVLNGGLNQLYSSAVYKFTSYENLLLTDIDTLNADDFMFADVEIIKNILDDDGVKVIIAYEDEIHLKAENKILQLANLDRYFEYIIIDELYNKIKENPKNYVYHDNNLANLYKYHNLGCWTVYLTNYIITSLQVLGANNPLNLLNSENLKILKKQGTFFTFSIFFFYQIMNYYKLIKTINARSQSLECDKDLFQKKLTNLNVISVLVFYRFHFKKAECYRGHHFLSNESVNYISYCGSNGYDIESDDEIDLTLNGEFDCILPKFSDSAELTHFRKLVTAVEKFSNANPSILLINSFKSFNSFMEREKMVKFLEEFCDISKVKETSKKYGSSILLPKCISVKYREVETADQYTNFIKTNKISLPIIMKYTGPRHDFNHLLMTVCTEEGIINYCTFMKEYVKGYEEGM